VRVIHDDEVVITDEGRIDKEDAERRATSHLLHYDRVYDPATGANLLLHDDYVVISTTGYAGEERSMWKVVIRATKEVD
jgi:hypothetical protein